MGKRDRALLLMGWASGGRRRSEIVGATIENLNRISDEEYEYDLAYSKSNQAGIDRPENIKPISGIAARALTDWLQVSGIKSGHIFRRVLKGGHLGGALAAAAVRDIVLKHCTLAGIMAEGFSAHSLRSGFVTEASRRDIPLADVMALTRHTNVNTVMRYFRSASKSRRTASRLMDAVDKPRANSLGKFNEQTSRRASHSTTIRHLMLKL